MNNKGEHLEIKSESPPPKISRDSRAATTDGAKFNSAIAASLNYSYYNSHTSFKSKAIKIYHF